MRLVDLVAQETGVEFPQIMLLRHSNSILDKLVASGGSVEEYTNTQPTGSRYDFLANGKERVNVVVVIYHDRVYGVFRVLGVDAEGTTYSLASEPHRKFDIKRGYPDRPARRFRLVKIPCSAESLFISGWKRGPRSPTARSDGKLFWEIKVIMSNDARLTEEVILTRKLFEGSLCRITVNAYERNPEARDECIAHYGTTCIVCGFNFGKTYGLAAEGIIHVHHLKPLSKIGLEYEVDPITDLRPVCPNCHAVIHRNGVTRSIEEVKRLLDERRSGAMACRYSG